MRVVFIPNDTGSPSGKLADAELHFDAPLGLETTGRHGGPLAGLKLIGFAVWQRADKTRHVTFPARQYSVNGERRSFALLRPVSVSRDQPVSQSPGVKLGELILAEYAQFEADGLQKGMD